MFHHILYFTYYQCRLKPEQREALKRLGIKRKNFFLRFLVLVDEIMFDNDQDWLKSKSRLDAYRQGERRMEPFRANKKELDNLKEECRRLDIPAWIIGYEAPG